MTVGAPIVLDGYQIVIPDNAADSVEELSAYELKAALAKMGYSLAGEGVITERDVTVNSSKYIYIGSSPDEGIDPTGTEYTVSANRDGEIRIAAGSYYGYRAAIEYIQQKGGIPTYTEYTNDASLKYLSKPDASVRVMFYNVYGYYNWSNPNGGSPALALRQDLQRDLLSTYAPDVIGFQEYVANTYHAEFNSTLSSLGYAQVDVSKGTANCTPLFYNPSKVALVKNGQEQDECGFELYQQTNDDPGINSKSVTWAIFEELDANGKGTGHKFAVFSTHFSHESGADAAAKRCHNAEQLLGIMEAVLNRNPEYNNIPVIMGGDLNYWKINDTKEPHQILTSSGLTYLAQPDTSPAEYTNRWEKDGDYSQYTESYHGYYRYDPNEKIYDMSENSMTTDRYSLDYIFLGGDKDSVTVKKYIIVNNDLTYRASDHSPTFVDFVFN